LPRVRSVFRFAILTSIASAVALSPSTSLPAPAEVLLSAGPTGPITEGRRVDDYARLARAIVGVLNTRLQLPVPAYSMEIYSVPAEFEQALITKMKFKPDVARTTATFAKAFVGNRRVMVNEPALAEWPWPERVVTLAHEIVHACQLELSGHRSLVRYQWLVEGFAEWGGYRVAHELGIVDFAASRSDILKKARKAKATTGLAPLADLDSLEQWIAERKKRSFDASYPYAFLAVEFLMQRHSYERTLDFFRRRRESADPATNFKAAFGENLSEFQLALDRHLAELLK
jgi:hypothetical protein